MPKHESDGANDKALPKSEPQGGAFTRLRAKDAEAAEKTSTGSTGSSSSSRLEATGANGGLVRDLFASFGSHFPNEMDMGGGYVGHLQAETLPNSRDASCDITSAQLASFRDTFREPDIKDRLRELRPQREWRNCRSILEFFEEFRKFELGKKAAQPAAELYEKFGRAYKDFKRFCANKPEWNLPEPVQASDLYDLKPPNENLWRARFTIKGLTPERLEQVLTTCAVDDLGGQFRFSGYYIYDKQNNSIVYQFNNGLGDRPGSEACEHARSVLSQRLKEYGATRVESASTNDPDREGWENPAKKPPENPKAKYQVPFGKTRGYTDQDQDFLETFESFAIINELGRDRNNKWFKMIDAHILSVGGKHGPYKEAVGLILAEHDEDMKKICRAGVVLGQEFLAFENFHDRTAIAAIKKKQQPVGQKTEGSSSDID